EEPEVSGRRGGGEVRSGCELRDVEHVSAIANNVFDIHFQSCGRCRLSEGGVTAGTDAQPQNQRNNECWLHKSPSDVISGILGAENRISRKKGSAFSMQAYGTADSPARRSCRSSHTFANSQSRSTVSG